jgi:hypothetical protein
MLLRFSTLTTNLFGFLYVRNLSITPFATMTQANQERVLQNIFKNVGVDALSEPRMVEFVATVSAPLAGKMLRQIGLDENTRDRFRLLDNGAGLGVVAAELHRTVKQEVLAKSSIISGDFSESAVEFVAKIAQKQSWPNTEVRVIDAQVWLAEFMVLLAPALGHVTDVDCGNRRLISRIMSSAT